MTTTKQLVFDTQCDSQYGWYECKECKKTYYIAEKMLHEKGCTSTGWGNCAYIIGPKVIDEIVKWAQTYGDDRGHPLTGISLNDVRQQLPESRLFGYQGSRPAFGENSHAST